MGAIILSLPSIANAEICTPQSFNIAASDVRAEITRWRPSILDISPSDIAEFERGTSDAPRNANSHYAAWKMNELITQEVQFALSLQKEVQGSSKPRLIANMAKLNASLYSLDQHLTSLSHELIPANANEASWMLDAAARHLGMAATMNSEAFYEACVKEIEAVAPRQ
ncbi:MAG: hypothetical protein ABW184_07160 [Sphingobium sp.]